MAGDAPNLTLTLNLGCGRPSDPDNPRFSAHPKQKGDRKKLRNAVFLSPHTPRPPKFHLSFLLKYNVCVSAHHNTGPTKSHGVLPRGKAEPYTSTLEEKQVTNQALRESSREEKEDKSHTRESENKPWSGTNATSTNVLPCPASGLSTPTPMYARKRCHASTA